MLYFLGCNWQKLPKLIKYFKEPSVGARKAKISEDYVAICKPGQNFISTIEKLECQSSPVQMGHKMVPNPPPGRGFAPVAGAPDAPAGPSGRKKLSGVAHSTKSLPLATSLAGFGFGFYTARDPLVAPAPPGPIRRARTE